ncbi:MAG: lipid-binding SYLF domain-containing protein [Pseudomonadota bacterium]
MRLNILVPVTTAFSVLAMLAAPALADTAAEIDAGVTSARNACATDVPGCNDAAEKAQGMLVFPSITKGAIGVGGSYGEGALIVDNKTDGYYSTAAASIGLQLGGETYSQIIMFMTLEALDEFRNSSGWEVGGNAKVAMIDKGKAADVNSIIANNPVIAFVFGQQGLMGDLSIEGAKVSKLDPDG